MSTTPARPTETAEIREALARTISTARGLNPDCQHEGPAADGTIDGRWARKPTANCPSGRVPWHYGWRNHTHVADALIAGPLAALSAATAQAERTAGELAAAKAALKPFAEFAECFDRCPDSENLVIRRAHSGKSFLDALTVGDLRTARAALTEEPPHAAE